ncbi:MAG: fused MFS/spermidine synthase [Gammaproteobacteria bacterium]|nr:fused MFS/spermidine synthase [Gammaproteobacteria bacterium]MBL6999218.1 fused MFS/spermidine synthase [Gammaproteobacteria bacterium]
MTDHSTTACKAQIRQQGDTLQLVFEHEADAIQSAINLKQPHRLVMENLQYLMGILLFMPAPQNILLLGVGGGSLIQFFRHYLPQSHITAVDYDQGLLDLAHQQMLLPQASEHLSYAVLDARQFIIDATRQYDLIVVDIFDGSQSPRWLLTDDFTRQLQGRLSKQGALAYNLLIHSETAFSTFYKRLRQLFKSQTLCLEVEEYENILLYALNFRAQKRSMMQNIEQAALTENQYQLPFRQMLSVIYNINPVDAGII